MTPISIRRRGHSHACKLAITLFSFVALSWLILPDSLLDSIQPIARAANLTVNSLADTADATLGDGICADAGGICTLRAAIQEANVVTTTDTITFSITGTINLTGALPDLNSNLTINGPGSGLLTVRRNTGGDYRIFTINTGWAVTLSGLTVTNGRTPDSIGSATALPGGGIFQAGGVLTLRDVVVSANSTGDGGTNNNSGSSQGGWGGFGGGIYASGTLTITNSVVSNNSTGKGGNGGSGGSGGRGAGIYFAPGTLTLSNVVINGNRTGNSGGMRDGNSGYGGGIWSGGDFFPSQTTAVNMTNVTISNNSTGDNITNGDAGGGAGIYVYQGTATLMNSTVSNNHSGNGNSFGSFGGGGGSGGGIFNNGTLTVTNSLISGNTTGNGFSAAGNAGGGISNNFILTLINSTITGNSTGVGAGGGGGIYSGATLTMTNCTVTGNSATDDHLGHGVVAFGTTNFGNTIIARNGSSGGGPDVRSGFSNINYHSLGHNLIGNADGNTGFNAPGDQVGTGAAPLNPQLGPLTDNGGPTLTHALLVGSPALDAGDDALTKDASNNSLTTDQRGAGRFEDSADADTIATVDIGAFEFHPSLENVSDKTTNEDTQLVFSFAVGDAGPAVTSVTATSNNQALVPDTNLLLTGAGAVRTLQTTPLANLSGTVQITLTVTYSGGSVSTDTFLLTVNSVNDVPTFTKGVDQTVSEDAGAQTITNWATGIDAGPNEAAQALTFLVTGNTNAALFSAQPSISASGALTYTPAPDVNGAALITVVLKDNGGTTNGGQDTSAAQTFTINVTAINDAPTFTKGTDQTVNEDSGFQSIANWATSASAGPNESTQSLTFVVTGNTNAGLFSVAPAVNSFGTLSYLPANNASGSATITIVLKDNGGTANGGQDTSPAQTFTINVTAVNDAPINSVPFSPITNQNTTLVFSTGNFNAFSVTDVDAGTDPIRITLNATQGTLTLGATTGIAFVAGDGTDDVTMTFTGTISAVNTCLNGLMFKPTTNFSGAASIQIITDDQGHNGTGGAKTDTDTVTITVRAGGTVQFNNATYSVNENIGIATITVTRTGGSSGSGSISYSTSSGSATGGANCSSAGADYLNASGTLSWGNGDSSAKSFNVLFCGDSTNELDESVNLTLSNPTGSVTLGSSSIAILTILNDDAPVLLTLENTERAVALDLTTQTPEPFSLTTPNNLGTDQRRRVSVFVWRLSLLPGDTAANVTVIAEDDQGGVYGLPVEYIGPLPGLSTITQVVVRLPDNVVGTPRDLWVSVQLRGPGSNRALIRVTSP